MWAVFLLYVFFKFSGNSVHVVNNWVIGVLAIKLHGEDDDYDESIPEDRNVLQLILSIPDRD